MTLLYFILALFVADYATHQVMAYKSKKSDSKSGFLYAKFTPGAIVSEIRGKIAATVFSRNRGGAVIRNRIKPINRRSTGQSTRRQALGSLASAWRGLTQTQRDSWNNASQNFPLQDTLGQTIFLSGEQLYVRFNANLLLIGESAIDTAPSPFAFAVLTASLSAEDDTVAAAFDITFTPSPMTAGNTIAVFATRNLSPGIEAPNASAFRYIGQIDPSDTTPKDLVTEYVAEFGNPIEDQKIFIELRPISTAGGQGGTPLRASAIVTASS